MGDDPPYLTVGTEVSAKYKGAFCEAKIKKVVRVVKCKVTFKSGLGSTQLSDDLIKGPLRVGATVEAKHPDSSKNAFIEAVVNKIQDCSQYTVVFDDGDITTLRRSALCLKSGRHFNESETLDQLPLTHPEHFSNPVVGGRRNVRRRGRDPASNDNLDESSDDDSSVTTSPSKKCRRKNGRHDGIGKVVCVDITDKKKGKDSWFPALIVSPSAQETVKIRIKDEYLVRSFRDGRYYTVPRKEITEFTKDGAKPESSSNILKSAVDKALLFLEKNELPPHWDREALFADVQVQDVPEEDEVSDSEESDDGQTEERDRFVAQLYKFMDERGTPINKVPVVCNKDLDLYKLYKVVSGKGGYNKVTNSSQWKPVTIKMGFGPMPSTSTINLVKQGYKKFIHNFDELHRKLGFNSLTQITAASTSAPRSSRILFGVRHASTSSLSSKETIKKEEPKSPPKEEEKEIQKKVEEEPLKPVIPEKEELSQPEETPRRSRSRQESRLKKDVPTAATATEEHPQPPVSPEKEPSKPAAKKRKTTKDKDEKSITENETLDPTPTVVQVNSPATTTRKGSIRGKYKKKSDKPEEVIEVPVKKVVEDSPRRQHISTDVRIQPGDKLKVYYGPEAEGKSYGAKVVEVNDFKQQYLVHYHGWNNRYDEWIGRERILENISLRSDQQPSSTAEKNSNHIESATSGSETGGSTKGPQNPKAVRKKKTSNASSLNSDSSSSRGVRSAGGATTRKRLSSEGDVPLSKRKPRRRASLSGPESIEDSSPSDMDEKTNPPETITLETESKIQAENKTPSQPGNNLIDLNQIRSEMKGLDKMVKSDTPDPVIQPIPDIITTTESSSDVYEFSDEAPASGPTLKMFSPRSPDKKEEQHPLIESSTPPASSTTAKVKSSPVTNKKQVAKSPSPRKKVATPRTNSVSTKQKEKPPPKSTLVPFPVMQTLPPAEVPKPTITWVEKPGDVNTVEIKPQEQQVSECATVKPPPPVPALIPKPLSTCQSTLVDKLNWRLKTPGASGPSTEEGKCVATNYTALNPPILLQPATNIQLHRPRLEIPGELKKIVHTPRQPICIRPAMATISPIINNNLVRKPAIRIQVPPNASQLTFPKKEAISSETLVAPAATILTPPRITIVSHTIVKSKPTNLAPIPVVPEKPVQELTPPSVPTKLVSSIPPVNLAPTTIPPPSPQPIKTNSIPSSPNTPVLPIPIKKKRKMKSQPVADSSSDSSDELAKIQKPIRKKPKIEALSKLKAKSLKQQIPHVPNPIDIKSPEYDDTPVLGISVVFSKPKPTGIQTSDKEITNNKSEILPPDKPSSTPIVTANSVPPSKEIFICTAKVKEEEPVKLISPIPTSQPIQSETTKCIEPQPIETKPPVVYPPQSVVRTDVSVPPKTSEVRHTEPPSMEKTRETIKSVEIKAEDNPPSTLIPMHENESRNSLLCEEEIPGSPQPDSIADAETEKIMIDETIVLESEIKTEPIEAEEDEKPEVTLLTLNRHRSIPSPVFGSTGINNAVPQYKSNDIPSTPPSTPTPDSSSLSSRSPRDHEHIDNDHHDGDISNLENGLSKSPKMLDHDRSDTDSLDLDGLPQSHDMDDNSNSSECGAKYYGKSPAKRVSTYDKNDGNYSPPGQRRRISRKKSPDDYSRPYHRVGRASGGRRMGSYGHLNDSPRILPPCPLVSLGAPPTSTKFSFIPTLEENWDSEKRINAILSGMQEARDKYNELKSQIASFEKKKRKQKKREREKQKEIDRALKKEANHTGDSEDDSSHAKCNNDSQTSSSPIPNNTR